MPFDDPEDRELTAADDSSKSFWNSDTAPEDELQDGTNLPTGTNYIWQQRKSERWFEPSAAVENPNWRQTLERLSGRMKVIQLRGERFPVYLEQIQTPHFGDHFEARGLFHDCSAGGGLGLEPSFLKPQVAVVPSFAFPDAAGNPIATSAGEPCPFRLGFSRMHFIKRASKEDLQLFSDAAKVLSVLPSFVNEVLWKRWRQGFPLPEDGFDEGVWIDAIFETSWQQLPFSSLRASRKAFSSDGNTSVVLKGEGLFPRIPPDLWSMVPNVQGYTQIIRSELPDLLESSVQLIETILAIPERPSVDSRSLEFDEEHCQTCPTTPEQRKLVDLIASEKNRLSADDPRLKSFSEGSLQTLIANRFVIRREGFFECTPNGLRLFLLMTDQLVEETLEAGKRHFGRSSKNEVPVVTIGTVCEKICPQRNGRKTLKRILELSKQGDSPSDIAKKNAGRRGFSLPNISEQLTKVRNQFPDFLP